MKFKTEELLLAVEVRKLVTVRMEADTPPGLTLSQTSTWRNQNTPAYIKAAVSELEYIAELIEQARQSDR